MKSLLPLFHRGGKYPFSWGFELFCQLHFEKISQSSIIGQVSYQKAKNSTYFLNQASS
jgi:hypothetical protein